MDLTSTKLNGSYSNGYYPAISEHTGNGTSIPNSNQEFSIVSLLTHLILSIDLVSREEMPKNTPYIYFNPSVPEVLVNSPFIEPSDTSSRSPELVKKIWKIFTAFSLGEIDRKFQDIREINTSINVFNTYQIDDKYVQIRGMLIDLQKRGSLLEEKAKKNLRQIYFVGIGIIFGGLVLGSGILLAQPALKIGGLVVLGIDALISLKKAGDAFDEARIERAYKVQCKSIVDAWNKLYPTKNQ